MEIVHREITATVGVSLDYRNTLVFWPAGKGLVFIAYCSRPVSVKPESRIFLIGSQQKSEKFPRRSLGLPWVDWRKLLVLTLPYVLPWIVGREVLKQTPFTPLVSYLAKECITYALVGRIKWNCYKPVIRAADWGGRRDGIDVRVVSKEEIQRREEKKKRRRDCLWHELGSRQVVIYFN